MASNTVLGGRVPPHNDEAERAVLGAILLNDRVLADIMDFLHKEDFYKTGHQTLFEAIVDFRQENSSQAIDLITITEYLRKQDILERCGGISYISSLTSDVPTTTNAVYYAQIIRGLALRRRLLEISSEMREKAFDEAQDVMKMVDESEQLLSDINTSTPGGNKYYDIKSLVSRATDRILERFDKGITDGLETGYKRLDDMTGGFKPSEFIVIGARPSVGKTAFALSIAQNMAVRKNIKVGFFSLEMSADSLTERLLSSESKVDFKRIRNATLKHSDLNAIMEASGRLYEKTLKVQDTPNMKLLELRAQARRMRREDHIQIIFVDYIGLIDAEAGAQVPRHEQIAYVSRSMKALARELNIPIVCLSQVGRQSEGKEPTLADLRESGAIEQDADVVILMHRERISSSDDGGEDSKKQNEKNRDGHLVQPTKIILAKQRNGETGYFELGFVMNLVRFEELERDF
ncbi:MAG: replicative DNA helicase [Sphaerochaetaceae bacterium]|jgi:replicative DNA helicase